jgi:two-component system, chemotaxis family, CheB/CheR fusion protein
MICVVVDDDPGVCDSLRVLLELAGHAVADFPSAEAFLGAPALTGDACLIVDIHLSAMSGIELLEKLRIAGNPVPVILITAQPNAALTVRGQAAGALAILKKPFDPAEILRLVQNCTAP